MCSHHAVAFRIYDLKDTGVIEKDEVKRLLTQLLQDNPAIDLSDNEVDAIVEQVLQEYLNILPHTQGILSAWAIKMLSLQCHALIRAQKQQGPVAPHQVGLAVE